MASSEYMSEEARMTLRFIGLTDYEARAYMQLLKIGVTTASRISEAASIPYSKIYEVLNSLERKGWVETRSGRPKKYYPKSPIEALEAERLRLEEKMKTWRRRALEMLQPLYTKREIREKPDVWIFRGEFDAIAKMKDLISRAETELMIALPMTVKPFVGAIRDKLAELLGTNVNVFIMVSRDYADGLDALSKIGEVKVRESMFGGGIIADGREAILILGGKESPLVIWSDHLGLVKFAKDYFQHLWNTAETV